MPRYRAILVLSNEFGESQVAGGDVVFEPGDNTPVNTGLLDVRGTPLYRIPEHRPIGFNLTKTRA